MTEPRVVTEQDGEVAVLVLDHPPSRNGLSPAMRARLQAAFDESVGDPGVRAIVVTGAGGAFSAGSDIGEIAKQDALERVERLGEFQRFLAGWGDVPKPVLAAVEGSAAGGGVSMVLAADWAVAAEDAVLVSGWVSLGVAPDAGALWWLLRTMGPKHAWDWLHSSRRMTAREACNLGIVTTTCGPGQAREVAVARAREVAQLPPVAAAATKRLLRRSAATADLDSFLATELYTQAYLFGGSEHRDAVAAFLRRSGGSRGE